MLRTKNDRPTIGILPGWSPFEGDTPDRYLQEIFRGIQLRASTRRCNLLLAWGVGRVIEASGIHPAWPVVAPDSDFVPVGPWNTDGLIVFAPLLSEARSSYIQQVRAENHPVLFIATGEKGPAIVADNEGGIRQAIAHLVEHGHRRIAFIAGDPDDPGDSESRYRAYKSALVEFGLEDDPRLVAYGKHSLVGGRAAMWEILHSKVKFSAVQASDDVSAIGAMRVLRDAGLQIPRDVAVIGFDDQPDAIAQVPPLTSIQAPLIEIGFKALDLMLDAIEGLATLETIVVPTRLTRRQSCGCLPDTMLFATARDLLPKGNTIKLLNGCNLELDGFKQVWVEDMISALPEKVRSENGTNLGRFCTGLVEALIESIHHSDSVHFDTAMLKLLQEVEQVNADINSFQDAISALRLDIIHFPGRWPGIITQQFIEDLFHRARAAISESVQRVDHRHRYYSDGEAFKLSMLTARLSACLDKHQMIKILEEDLPEIGIRHAKVILFKPEGDDNVGNSLVVGPDPEVITPFQQFPTRNFPPKGLYPSNESLSVALAPLVFQNEPLGYVAFEASDISAIAAIVRQLAASLKAARMHTEIVELSIIDEITGIYNRRFLDLFLRKEVIRCQRFKRGLSVIMLDVDNFKEYNDDFGHPAGDEALHQLAKCLQSWQRKIDIVARYGGDEFLIILPETDEEGAVKVTEKIKDEVAALPILKRLLTLSMGLVTMKADEYGIEELIQRVDQALYEAKRSGKDKVCVY